MKDRPDTERREPAGASKPGKIDRRKKPDPRKAATARREAAAAVAVSDKQGKPERRKKPDLRKSAKSAAAGPAANERSAPGGRSTRTAPHASQRSAESPSRRNSPHQSRGKPGKFKAEETSSEPVKPQPARLQKVMAASGLGSRRALEQEIRDGSIQLNGATATLGQSIKVGDRLQWSEREWLVVDEQSQHRTLIYNKPEGEITSRADPEGRTTVFDRLPFLKDARWVAIGRLDINTTGLLLLTTDGELANAMMHPSKQVDREYICRVRGTVSDEQIAQLKEGVMLDDGPAHFNDVKRMGAPSGQTGANQWYQVTLLEGRNREVRRLWESMELMVSRLKRVRYGAALLPKGLKVGQWHEATARDHRVLREDVGLTEATPELNLQLVSNRQHAGNKHSSRSSRAQDKRNAGAADTRNARAPRKRGSGSAPDRERSTARSTQRERPGKPKGAAGRVADKQRSSKPGSPAGGGRRPGSKPRRGDS